MGDVEARYYIRFRVGDQPGVMARLAGALGDQSVSIEQMVQEGGGSHPGSKGEPATVVMLTHRATEGAVQAALASLGRESFMVEPARVLRIEDV
jgi:homoserine dehydrogenase